MIYVRDSGMLSIPDEFSEEELGINEGKTSSPGLIALINRLGYRSTGDSAMDIEIAKKFMPKSYRDKE